ncbi:hypothetical protein BKA62DRAFT_718774 [Auriculariales sp. MPI-PUGE-AT-0066]|nr:hypothetical protein BKA62DRAFT_718774 [Auriculariales sp. MPI-PUGE-AT-0066]
MPRSLPDELKVLVCHGCTRQDMARLIRVSRAWHACGERLLYREVVLKFHLDVPERWDALLHPLRRFMHGSSLASAVVRLRVSVRRSYESRPCDRCWELRSCERTRREFHCCERTRQAVLPMDQYNAYRKKFRSDQGLKLALDKLEALSAHQPSACSQSQIHILIEQCNANILYYLSNQDNMLALDNLVALSSHRPLMCSERLDDNLVILWALLAVALRRTSALEVLELPTVVPEVGSIYLNAISAVPNLKRLRQLAIPPNCLSRLSVLLSAARRAPHQSRGALTVCIHDLVTNSNEITAYMSQLVRLGGIFPLILHAGHLEIVPYAVKHRADSVSYVSEVAAFLDGIAARRDFESNDEKILFRINLALWQASHLHAFVGMIPVSLAKCITRLEVEFMPHGRDDDESPCLSTAGVVDAIVTLPNLKYVLFLSRTISKTRMERVIQFSGEEVVRDANSKGLRRFYQVSLLGR